MGRAGLDQAAGRILDRTSNNEPNNRENTSAPDRRWAVRYFRHPVIGQLSAAVARFSGQTALYSLPWSWMR